MPDSVAEFRTSFLRRSEGMLRPGQRLVDEPGVCGAVGSPGGAPGRLLVTDDRAEEFLLALGAGPPVQIVSVFDAAPRCRTVIDGLGSWMSEDATAMLCVDLSVVEAPRLADGLTLRSIRRVDADAQDGVDLAAAAVACLRADPMTADEPLEPFLAFLRSLPPSTRLLAAVDASGEVRATAGASALGDEANVYFVSTNRAWRGKGVATAMTAAALVWARGAGACRAALDASPAGLSIYLRLGFVAVSATRLFIRF